MEVNQQSEYIGRPMPKWLRINNIEIKKKYLSIPVVKYDLEWNLIKKYGSIDAAAKDTKCNTTGLKRVLFSGKNKYKDFYWKLYEIKQGEVILEKEEKNESKI